MNVSGSQFEVINDPTPAKLQALVRKENFRAVLPSGLPVGTTLAQAARYGPGAFDVSYNFPGKWRVSHHLLRIIIANRADVGAVIAPSRGGYTFQTGPVQARWTIGDEEVTALGYAATPTELANIKRAMIRRHE